MSRRDRGLESKVILMGMMATLFKLDMLSWDETDNLMIEIQMRG